MHVSVGLIGSVTLGHARAMLTGLTGTLAFCKARIASTMLCFTSPFEAPVPGTPPVTIALPIRERKPSYPVKKKSLSFLIGPPTTPPNCFSCVGNLSHATGVPSGGGAHLMGALSTVGLNKLRASQAALR